MDSIFTRAVEYVEANFPLTVERVADDEIGNGSLYISYDGEGTIRVAASISDLHAAQLAVHEACHHTVAAGMDYYDEDTGDLVDLTTEANWGIPYMSQRDAEDVEVEVGDLEIPAFASLIGMDAAVAYYTPLFRTSAEEAAERIAALCA